jgi:hypothetical protein
MTSNASSTQTVNLKKNGAFTASTLFHRMPQPRPAEARGSD